MRLNLPAILLVVLAVAACGADDEQARVCQRFIPAFESDPGSIEILRQEPHGSAENSIVVHYRARDAGGQAVEHSIACWFRDSAFGSGRLAVEDVSTDRHGLLSPVKLEMLRIWLRVGGSGTPAGEIARGAPAPALSDPAYALQAVVNAIVMGCVYALVAIGFSLIYGVIGRINLAFGDMSAIAAYAAFTGVVLLGAAGTVWWFAGLVAVLLAAIGVAVLANLATERLIFRPLRGSASQAPLIATIGLAIFLREFIRLTQGSRDRWLPSMVTEPYLVPLGGGHSISIGAGQLVVLGLTVALCGMLGMVMTRSAHGRRYRACCDDFKMAALLGVDAGRTVAVTFALGAVFAGAAGAVVALYYGTVGAYMGMMIGFKALVAAVVGGMGSIAGAVLGGIIVALLESLWSSYMTMAYRDVVIFGLLAFVLVFRPNGLLGRPGP
jgi:branched-chain amino acid transport system permease protein